FALVMFSGTMVLSAQDYCIVYRASVVLFGGRHLTKIVTTRAKSIALLAIFGVASVNAFVWYFHTIADKYFPEKHPELRAILNPGSDSFICLTFGRTPIWPLGSIVIPLAGITEAVFYFSAVGTVLFIRKAATKMSAKSRKLNLQLSVLLLMQ
ncbi:hypothetical protein AAVH_41495, partial [Aphelenchoides avenae]